MGKKSGLAIEIDGFLHEKIDLSGGTVTVFTGAGKLRGYYVNTTLSGVVTDVLDDTTEMIEIPGLTSGPQFVPCGDLEFLTSLVVTPRAGMTGSITIVYNPYKKSVT